MAISLTYRCFV